MTLTPQEVALVRSTFRLLEPKSNVAALAFYQRILAASPSLRPSLAENLDSEAERLMSLLRLVSDLADQPEVLRARLGGGARLLPRGARFDAVRGVDEALLWSLGATLGGEFTPAARAAWAALVGAMTDSD